MTKYRVKQIDNDIFIAQRKEYFFSRWVSIDKKDFLYEWWILTSNCKCNTFEEAENIIIENKKLHKISNNIKYFYYV